jgi:uncharacterized protein (DUF3820 family)
MKMPFGKYRGQPLDSIPEAYLAWVLDNCENVSPSLREAIRVILFAPTDALTADVIGSWYRRLAMEFHPDRRGGSLEGMKAVNRAKELLLEAMA